MRPLSGNRSHLKIAGETVREVIDNLEAECPGIKERLLAEGRVKPGIAIAIDGVVLTKGLGTKMAPDSEVHFVPAISGGTEQPKRPLRGPGSGYPGPRTFNNTLAT